MPPIEDTHMKIFLARHAKAGKRLEGRNDKYRQLVADGHSQANRIANFFAPISLDAIYTSPAVRCFQTVEPTATQKSLEIVERETLWEDSLPSDIAEAINQTTAETSLWCSHGNLIPAVVEMLQISEISTTRRGAVKGAVWAIEGEPNNWATASYIAPSDL